MNQAVIIKTVMIDHELKVTFKCEFVAKDPTSQQNLFSLISMQGDLVNAILTPAQMPVFQDNHVRDTDDK